MKKYFIWFALIAVAVFVGCWAARQVADRSKELADQKFERDWQERPQIGFAPQPAALAA